MQAESKYTTVAEIEDDDSAKKMEEINIFLISKYET